MKRQETETAGAGEIKITASAGGANAPSRAGCASYAACLCGESLTSAQLIWDEPSPGSRRQPGEFLGRVLVLTQACDLAQTKTTRVVVALVQDAEKLVAAGILTPSFIQSQIRVHRVHGWYFLPMGPQLGESIVDLRDLHTVPRSSLEELIRSGRRICQLETPYREHLAQHFANTYSRIGLPAVYETTHD